MLNVPAPTCLSTQPTQSLPLLHPTMRPSMPLDLSAFQVQNTVVFTCFSDLTVLFLSVYCSYRITFLFFAFHPQTLIFFIKISYINHCSMY